MESVDPTARLNDKQNEVCMLTMAIRVHRHYMLVLMHETCENIWSLICHTYETPCSFEVLNCSFSG